MEDATPKTNNKNYMGSAVQFVFFEKKKKGWGLVTPDEAALLHVSVATTARPSRDSWALGRFARA